MEAILVSILYAPWIVMLFVSVLGTVIHTADEIFGSDKPFWDYAEDITHVFVPWHFGFLLFCGLAATLIGLAVGGYFYGNLALLSILIGARLGDFLFSHITLNALYKRDNPGLWSSLYYLGESVLAFAIYPEIKPLYFALGFCAFGLFWLFNLVFNREKK